MYDIAAKCCEMLQKGWEFHYECPLCLLEAKSATDMLEGCQRLIEEWRLVHRERDAEIRDGKPVNIEGGEDSSDWVQAEGSGLLSRVMLNR